MPGVLRKSLAFVVIVVLAMLAILVSPVFWAGFAGGAVALTQGVWQRRHRASR
jgi:hypothetical protein